MTSRTRRAGRNGRGRGGGGGGRGTAARWQESAGTVAVVADEVAFRRMRRYPTFAHTDHAGYLRRTEALLRSLARRHGHTSVALFDPADYDEYCGQEGIDRDSPASRARYTAEIAARGATVPYDGQPLARLVPLLLTAHRRQETWGRAGDLLAASGPCADCGAPLARCAFQRAATLLTGVLERTGPGGHHLVASLLTGAGPFTAALRAEVGSDGGVRLADADALVLCTVLAAGLATDDPGGLVLRSTPADGGGAPEQVCGWSLRGGRLHALTEGEVFAAYCTDALTGDPVPPEPDVVYRAAPGIARPPCPEG
ncbi:hypothetical protein [Streptomyces avicenniae]|uniref:hypothetical protein n=1 Tax=Streptomyces avicenniae TaxID=500153 RepID=UPI000699DC1D|nr:hypothetical protein [Streptomyces avicenniae]